jgi:YVTN family beta-propeller protein
MSSTPRTWSVLALRGLVAFGCLVIGSAPEVLAQTSVGPRQSSPIALSGDNTRLVNINPNGNSVSVFDVSGANPVKLAEIPVGTDPSSVAIQPNGIKAYVSNAFSGSVSVINLAVLAVSNTITVGVEPQAVALSPNGTRLYVANAATNSLSVINTTTEMVVATVDLSAFGTSPQAIAVTNNGDANDTDETIFVALFFGQLRPGKTFLQEGQDDQREGRVVALSAATNTPLGSPNPVVLGPIASAGFNSNGQLAPAVGLTPTVASTNPQTFTTPTGAFPNQLAAIALQPGQSRAYVVSTGASPNGPLRFNQMAQGLVSVFNTTARTEIPAAQTDPNVRRTAPLNLNQGINLGTTPAPRLFLTNPVAMAWRPDGSDAWVVIQNSDLVVRLTVDANGIPTVNNPLVAGPSTLVRVDLEAVVAGQIAGKAPRGIVINTTGTRAYVTNFVSRSVTVVDISNPTAPAIAGTAQSAALPTPGTFDAVVQLGAELFFTGRGPQSRMSQESWGGCIVCHPNGRSDNVTWMFDAGPRQTIPLDSTFSKSNPADQRILNWSAVRDEVHDFELNTRGVFGGRGLIDDDRLFYAIGGTSGATPTDSALIEQFQQATGAVSTTNDLQNGVPLPMLLGARRDFGVATLNDGRVFIIGGRSGAGQGSLIPAANAVLEFNPRKKGLVARSATGFTLRHSLGAAAVRTSQGDRIYAVGGYSSTSGTANPVNTVEEFNPATNTWRTVASLPTAVAQFGITVAGGINGGVPSPNSEPLQLIHVVSGNTGSENAPSVVNPNPVQRFQADPAGPGTWTPFPAVGLTLRRNHGAATALRGAQSRVFVIGGQDAGGTVLSTVEEYLAQAVSVVAPPHTDLPAPRARFGVGSTLTTNQIYVFGGVDGTGADQTSIFEYTTNNNGPVAGPPGTPSGAWLTRGNLSVARHGLGSNSPPGVTNFLPVRSAGRDSRQDSISLWTARKVRSARAPVAATDPGAMAGRTLFGTVGLVQPGFSCATCHGGPKWTRSQVDYNAPPSPDVGIGFGNQKVMGAELRQTATQGPNPGQFPGVLINVGTFAANSAGGRVNEIRFNGADISQAIAPLGANGFNIPSVLSVHETAPYYYNGLAQTLDEVLDGSKDGNGGTQHHFVANVTQRDQLKAFLRSIDSTTPTFP